MWLTLEVAELVRTLERALRLAVPRKLSQRQAALVPLRARAWDQNGRCSQLA